MTFIIIVQVRQKMKSISQLKEQIYDQAMNSGYFKNMQAQLKTYVFDLIEKQYNNGRNKTGFQYEHPLLPKLKKYPLTSLCMDLIQQFLQSFKFKHTLNVFKKEINRSVGMNRTHLSQSFKIEIKNPESQAVLLSLVQQMVSGDIGAIKTEVKNNNYMENSKSNERHNNFMGDTTRTNNNNNQFSKVDPIQKPNDQKQANNISKSFSNSNINSNSNSNSQNNNSLNSSDNISKTKNQQQSFKDQKSKQNSSKIQEPSKQQESKDKKKDSKGKKAPQKKQPPPQAATDLLADIFKYDVPKVDKKQEQKKIFESKKAFSLQKQKKVLDPSESGANKIRGGSMGKSVSSFMKFMPQQVQQKNQSYIDEQLDQFQQSKDSIRKNPLYSSSQSGFDKSGFDESVDSNAILDYQYHQKAKKFAKKF